MEGKKEDEAVNEEEENPEEKKEDKNQEEIKPKAVTSAPVSESSKHKTILSQNASHTSPPEPAVDDTPIVERKISEPKETEPAAQPEAPQPASQVLEVPGTPGKTPEAPRSAVQISEPPRSAGQISETPRSAGQISERQRSVGHVSESQRSVGHESQRSGVHISEEPPSAAPIPEVEDLESISPKKTSPSRSKSTGDGSEKLADDVLSTSGGPKKRPSSRAEPPTSIVACLTGGLPSLEEFSCSKLLTKRSPFVHNPPQPEERRPRVERPRSPRDYIINLREDLADFQESHGLPRTRDYSFMSLGLALAQETARAICSVFLMFSELFPVVAIISLVLRFALDKLIDILETNEPVPKLKKTLIFCLQMIMILIPLWILIGTIVLPLAGLLFSIFRKLLRFKGGKSGRVSCSQPKKPGSSSAERK